MRFAELHQIAGIQYGVVSRRQAAAAGFSRHEINRMISTGQWSRPHPGVLALGIPTSSGERWHRDVMAGQLWMGEASALSHWAGGRHWRLDGCDKAEPEFSTTANHRSQTLTIHRVRVLEDCDVRLLRRIRVTSVERTLIDIAAVAERDILETVVASALRKGLTSIARLGKRIDQVGGGRRTSELRALISDGALAATDSDMEVRLNRVLGDSRLPPSVPQHTIRTPDGKFVARVDRAYPELKFAIEADGWGPHSKRGAFRRDRIRLNAITKLGWLVHFVTWEDLEERPESVVAEIEAAIAERRAGLGSSGAEPLHR